MPSYPTHRLIRTPSGQVLKAKVIPPDTFGLGTQLDAFFMERNTEPSHYTPMGKGTGARSRRASGDAPQLPLSVVS